MKRITAVLLIAVLLISGCGKKTPAETLPAETEPVTEATEAAPELEYATAQVDRIPAVLETLRRGDSVDLVKAFDEDHYIVKRDVGYGLVEKNLVRMESAPAYEAWTGYAYPSAKVYDNYRLAGESVRTLDINTQVQVLDDLNWCFLVEVDGMTGYMKQATVAKNVQKTPDSGKNTPGKTPGGSGEGQDGGEISLLATWVPQEGAVSGKATVLADETQVVLGYFDRGDKIPVLAQDPENGNLTVCLDGVYAQVLADQVRTEKETDYTAWEGKTGQIVSVYGDRWMMDSPIDRLNVGTVVKVLFELDNCYLIEVGGITGYVAKGDITPAEPEAARETVPESTVPAETRPKATQPTESTESTESTEATEPTTPETTPPATTEPTVPETTPPATTEPTVPETTPPATTEPTVPETTPPATTEPTVPETTPPATTEPTVPETTEPTVPETTAPEWTPPIL